MTPGINRPGLAKLNTQSSTLGSASFKATTANKLASSTRSGQSYGIMAQRSAVGTGAIFNVKRYNSASISAQRHALNDNRTIIRNNNVIGTPIAPHNCSGNNAMNKYAAALAITGMLTKTLGSLTSIKGSSGDSAISKLNNMQKTNGGSAMESKDLPALSAMSDAKDSTSLRAAIETAEADKASMQSELAQLESQLPSMKETSEAATKQLKELEPKVDAKEKEVKQKENIVSDKETALSAAEKDKASKLEVAKNMEAAVGEAATNYTKASEALVNAESTLASTPKTKIGPNGVEVPNEPAYSNAQKAVETARKQKQEAQTKLDEAKANHEKAVGNYEKSITAYEKAAKDVQTAKDELKTANDELEKSQKELNELKKQESDANGKVKAYKEALDKQKDLTKNIEKYGDNIKSQKTRLAELEKKESEELRNTNEQMNSLSNKIDARNGKIDTKDGLSFMEKRRLAKNEKNSAKYESLTNTRNELQERVNYTKLSKMAPTYTFNGTTFRQAEFGGDTLYMVGAKKVSAEEYQALVKAALDEDQE